MTFPLRSWSSDPVLIKPSTNDFIKQWNGGLESPNGSLNETALSGIFVRIAEEQADVPKDLSPSERDKYNRKMEKRERRRHSILAANKMEWVQEPIQRCSSSPNLEDMRFDQCQKRVSFSFKESHFAWSLSDDTYKRRQSHAPYIAPESPPANPKPILLKKPRATSLPLSHMDYETFNAWRKGSRISTEVQQEAYLYERKKQRKNSDAGWGSPGDILKLLFTNCFNRRRYRTSPQNIAVFVTDTTI